MGAWSYIAPQLEEIFGRKAAYAGRDSRSPPSACSPSTVELADLASRKPLSIVLISRNPSRSLALNSHPEERLRSRERFGLPLSTFTHPLLSMASLEVKIPPMGESISSGILAKWHVTDGAIVKKDQPLFELETDKITSEGTAEVAGRITFKVGAGHRSEDRSGGGDRSTTVRRERRLPLRPPQSRARNRQGAKSGDAVAGRPSPRRRRETGIDPTSAAGSGKGGRVTKGDVLAAGGRPQGRRKSRPRLPQLLPRPPPRCARRRRRRRTPDPREADQAAPAHRQSPGLRPARGRHAHDLQRGRHVRGHGPARQVPGRLREEARREARLHVFFTKAVVHALREIPAVNAQFDGDRSSRTTTTTSASPSRPRRA
jgi:2-oxoglutarate dehydrogenase E2 component (dihydrolipoamide succinyltransferase)